MPDRPSLEIAGADLPNKGTGTGFNNDDYGADTGPLATNSMGSITSSSKSDRGDTGYPKTPPQGG